MAEEMKNGTCCSNDEMLTLFGLHIPDMLDSEDCDEDFCEEYTLAMNRMRYLASRDEPRPVKVHHSGRLAYCTCGRCGATLRSDVRAEFCWKCGQRARWQEG